MYKTTNRKCAKSCAGFTLLEIMVVVTIIAIISSIAWSQYRNQLAKGKRSDAVAALTSVRAALISFKSDTGNYPANAVTAFNFLTGNGVAPAVGYRLSAPNGLPGAPAAPCLNERGFQAIAGTIANSVQSCGALWDIQVTLSNANRFTLAATAPLNFPLALRDAECLILTLDNLNVRGFTATPQGDADGILITRCWTE
jgi:prepilin-type N-terminal cleavage/methylation domain-containing protein